MDHDKPGAAQSDLPGREGQNSRPATASDRSTATNLTQVPGSQYLLTTQPHGVPALAQLSPAGSQNVPGGVTRIINITPSRGEPSPLRPSLTNQSIVNVLTKSPTLNIHNFQLIQSNDGAATNTAIATTSGAATPTHSRGIVKRSLISSPEKKDYAVKKLKVLNHKTIKSRLVQEKYDNHLAEMYLLESGGNILELVQFQRFPKNQQYLNYIREHSIDGTSTGIFIPHTTPSTPTATATSSLPGISLSNSSQLQPPTKPVPRMNQNLTSTVSPSLDVTSIKATSATSSTNQESIVEKAKQEAFVLQRIGELQKEGLWSEKRLPKVQEKQRTKAHWDFALEELMWLSTDFAQERKWKKINAKKCSRMVQKYFQEKALAAQRAEKAFEQHKKKLAAFCAKEIRNFWSNVEKLVEYRQNTILEEKRQRVIDHHLSFIVDQTEKYTRLLAEGMNKPAATVPSISNISSQRKSRAPSDDDFCPSLQSDEDDEETIEKEEAAPSNEDQSAELEALKKESQMELDDLLEDDVLVDYLLNRDNIRLSSDDSDDEMQETANATDSEEFDSVEESDTEKIEGSQTENQSIKMLLDDQKWEGEKTKTDDKNDLLNNATAIAESIQPKGNTLSSTTVSTKVPFLLQLPLREYQHIGLDWLVTMYERKLNGILADEMGLGKTIQTIALLAHLACEKGNWGPHLIIVPTSVMLNWEMECKKWCPGFKILTYYGPHKERKQKRRGWTKYNAFHICITSYKLVIQDHQSFRRKKWKYLILDEAQNIKNFKSQRWQLLLNFQSERRLLLTGTPLQNNLMELWSLMHFLMPSIFQSHREFKEWFSNPVSGMIEGNSEYNDSIIKRLHKVLRPFLLRRLKSEVEKQMPKKYEHIKMCRLSNRQRYLYDDFMSRAKTRETLASGNLLSVINVLMQLRKVCNHPNLFEVRPTLSPFQCDNIKLHIPSIVYSALLFDVLKHVNLYTLNLLILMAEFRITSSQYHRIRALAYKTGLKPPSTTNQPPPGTPPVRLRMRVVSVSQREQRPPQQPQQVSGQSISRTRVASRDSNTVVRNVGLPVLGMDVTGNSILRVTSSSGIQVASSSGMHVASSSGMQVVGSTGIQVASSSGIQVASSSGIQVVTTGVINTGMQVVTSGVVSSTMQVVSQGLVKTVPMLTFSQAAGQGLVSPINVASVLKHGDRASNYAQIVQTPTGKHLLLTSSPGSGGNSAVTHTAQKVMFLSTKQAIIPNSNSNLTSPNGNQIITRAYGRLSLTPITTNSIAPLSTAPPSGVASVRGVGPVRSTLPVSGIESTSSVASTSGIAPVRGITPLTKVGGITPITGITPIRGLAQTNKIATTSRNIHDSGAVLASSSPSTSSAPNCNTNTPQLVRERPRNPCFDFLDEIYPPKRQRVRRVSSEEEDTPDQRYRKRVRLMSRINRKRCLLRPLYGRELVDCVKITEPSTTRPWSNGRLHCVKAIYGVKPQWTPEFLKEALYTPVRRIHQLQDICDRFIIYIPSAKADDPDVRVWHPPPSEYQKRKDNDQIIQLVFRKTISPLHRIATMMVTQFPDRRLIQYDCGKLQMLDRLLRNLKVEGHRVLIFTQMTKMLDVLEAFLNFHGHIYLRLDGTTKVEQRQILMERFNSDKRIFVFILSTRSGGVGVNLTGADTVIFYDSDWNPTMDAQAQDRCHRIGQTRDVHIYRLISERTIEENILKKANQKRLLGNLAIEGGNFTTAYFKNNTTIVDLFNIDQTKDSAAQRMSELVEKRQDKETPVSDNDEDETSALENALAACEDDQDVQATKIATAEAVAELAEFDENIPLDHEEKEKEPEISKAQQTINDIIKTLTPVEKYAMQFLELTESTLSAEYLAAEERRIEEQKRIWEINQIATIKEQEEKRQREIEEENYMLTYSREDATNQVSFKNKIVAKGENVLKRTRRGGGKKTRSPSQPKTKKPRFEDGESSTLDLTKENLKPSEITSSSDKSTSDSDVNDQLSLKKPNNHLANPRLRSRGTVDINLWTLDVNPILPGVKPLKSNKPNRSYNDNKSDNKKQKQVYRKEEKDLSNKNNTKMDKDSNLDISIKSNIDEDTINTSDEDKWLADSDDEYEPYTKTDKTHSRSKNQAIIEDTDGECTVSETDNIIQKDELINSDSISDPSSYQIAVGAKICNSAKQIDNEESGDEADESDLEDETNFKTPGVSDSQKCETECEMENESEDLVGIKDLRVVLTDICRDATFQIPEIISTSVRSNSMDSIDLGIFDKAGQDESEKSVPQNIYSMERIALDNLDISCQEGAKSGNFASEINSIEIIELEKSNDAGQKIYVSEPMDFEKNSMSFDNANETIELEKSNKLGCNDKGEDIVDITQDFDTSEPIRRKSLDITERVRDNSSTPIKKSTDLSNNSFIKSNNVGQKRDVSEASKFEDISKIMDDSMKSIRQEVIELSNRGEKSDKGEDMEIIHKQETDASLSMDSTSDSGKCEPIPKESVAFIEKSMAPIKAAAEIVNNSMIKSSAAGQRADKSEADLTKLSKAGLESDKIADIALENNSMEVLELDNVNIGVQESAEAEDMAHESDSTINSQESGESEDPVSKNNSIETIHSGQEDDKSGHISPKDDSNKANQDIDSNHSENSSTFGHDESGHIFPKDDSNKANEDIDSNHSENSSNSGQENDESEHRFPKNYNHKAGEDTDNIHSENSSTSGQADDECEHISPKDDFYKANEDIDSNHSENSSNSGQEDDGSEHIATKNDSSKAGEDTDTIHSAKSSTSGQEDDKSGHISPKDDSNKANQDIDSNHSGNSSNSGQEDDESEHIFPKDDSNKANEDIDSYHSENSSKSGQEDDESEHIATNNDSSKASEDSDDSDSLSSKKSYVEMTDLDKSSTAERESDDGEDIAPKKDSNETDQSDGSASENHSMEIDEADISSIASDENVELAPKSNSSINSQESCGSEDLVSKNNSIETIHLEKSTTSGQEDVESEHISPQNDSNKAGEDTDESDSISSKQSSVETIDSDNSSSAGHKSDESKGIARKNDSNKGGQETDESDGSGPENNPMEIIDSAKSSIAGQESDESDDIARKSNSTINSQESSGSEHIATKNDSKKAGEDSDESDNFASKNQDDAGSEDISLENFSNKSGIDSHNSSIAVQETDDSDGSDSDNNSVKCIDSEDCSIAGKEDDECDGSAADNNSMKSVDSGNSSTAGQEDDEREHIATENDSNKAGEETDGGDSSASENNSMEIIDSDNASIAGQESDETQDNALENDSNIAVQETDDRKGSAFDNNSIKSIDLEDCSIAGQEDNECGCSAAENDSMKIIDLDKSSTDGQEDDESEHIASENDSNEAGEETDGRDSSASKNNSMEIIDSHNSSIAGQETDDSKGSASDNNSIKSTDPHNSSIVGKEEYDSGGSASDNNSTKSTDSDDCSIAGQEDNEFVCSATENDSMKIIDSDNSSTAGEEDDESEHISPENYSNRADEETDGRDSSVSENSSHKNSSKSIDSDDRSIAGQEDTECMCSAAENDSMKIIDSDNSSTAGQEDDESEHIASENDSNEADEESDGRDSSASTNNSMEIIDSDNASIAEEIDKSQDNSPEHNTNIADQETDEPHGSVSENNSNKSFDSDDCSITGQQDTECVCSSAENDSMQIIDSDNSSTAGQEDDESEHIASANDSNEAGEETDGRESSASTNHSMESIDSDNASIVGQETDKNQNNSPENNTNIADQETDEINGSSSENNSSKSIGSHNSSIADKETDESNGSGSKNNSIKSFDLDNASIAGQETYKSQDNSPENNTNIADQETEETNGSGSENNSSKSIGSHNSSIADKETDESNGSGSKNHSIKSFDSDDCIIAGQEDIECVCSAAENDSMKIIVSDNSSTAGQEDDESEHCASENEFNKAGDKTDGRDSSASTNNSMEIIDSDNASIAGQETDKNQDNSPENNTNIADQETDEINGSGSENNSSKSIGSHNSSIGDKETDESNGSGSKNNSIKSFDSNDCSIAGQEDNECVCSAAENDSMKIIDSVNSSTSGQEDDESEHIAPEKYSNKAGEETGGRDSCASTNNSMEIIDSDNASIAGQETDESQDNSSENNTNIADQETDESNGLGSENNSIKSIHSHNSSISGQETDDSNGSACDNNSVKSIDLDDCSIAGKEDDECDGSAADHNSIKSIDSGKSSTAGQEDDNKAGEEPDGRDSSASKNSSDEIIDSDNASIAGHKSDQSEDSAPENDSNKAGQEADKSEGSASKNNAIEIIDSDNSSTAGQQSDKSEDMASEKNSTEVIELHDSDIDGDDSIKAGQEIDESEGSTSKNSFMEIIELDNSSTDEESDDSETISARNAFNEIGQDRDEVQDIASRNDSNKAGREADESRGFFSRNNTIEVIEKKPDCWLDDWSDNEKDSNDSQYIAARNNCRNNSRNDSNKTVQEADESNGFVSKKNSTEIIAKNVPYCWLDDWNDESEDIGPESNPIKIIDLEKSNKAGQASFVEPISPDSDASQATENTSNVLRKTSLANESTNKSSGTKPKIDKSQGSSTSKVMALRKKSKIRSYKAGKTIRDESEAINLENNPMEKNNSAAQKTDKSETIHLDNRKIIDCEKSDESGQESDESSELDLSSDSEALEATGNMSMPVNKRCRGLRKKSKKGGQESIKSICPNSSLDLHDDDIHNVISIQSESGQSLDSSTTRNGQCISSMKVRVTDECKKSLKADTPSEPVRSDETFPDKDHDNITDCKSVAGASTTRSGLVRKYIPRASGPKKSTNNKKYRSGEKH